MIAPESNLLPLGFVVAMRARLVIQRAPDRLEWIIVSRSGQNGEHLLISWTLLPASSGEAPILLVPRQTAVAVAQADAKRPVPTTFLLTTLLPKGLQVAGEFLPARGYVKVFGVRPHLRVQSVGRCLQPQLHADWRIDAKRAAWFGEYFDDGEPIITGC
jgi:hypothetical protein